jgi:hypothetical protein
VSEKANGVWETTDMSLAAWMRAKGKRIISVHKIEYRRNEFRFMFEDKKSECSGLALDFLNSDAHDFDTALRSLKKMCFGPLGIKEAVSTTSRK